MIRTRRPGSRGREGTAADEHRAALVVFSASTGHVEDVVLVEDARSAAHPRSGEWQLAIEGETFTVVRMGPGAPRFLAATPDVDTLRLEPAALAVLKREGGKLSRLISAIGSQLARAVEGLTDEDVTALADRIASVLPSEPAAGAEAIGPVFETADLIEWRGVTKQAIHNQRLRGDILALRTSDGHWVYPEWQFDENGHVRKGVGESVRALAYGGMDPWTQAVWFRGESPDLGDESAASWLSSGKDPAAVVQLARRTANRWRQ